MKSQRSTFGSRFGSTTLFDATLVLRRTERPKSGDDHVEFVLAEQALGRGLGFGVWKMGLRAQRKMRCRCRLGRPGRAGVRGSNGEPDLRLCHRSRRGLSLRGVTLWTEEVVCWVWRFCVVCQKDLVAQLDGEGRSRELCANEENERKHTALAVYKEGKMMH